MSIIRIIAAINFVMIANVLGAQSMQLEWKYMAGGTGSDGINEVVTDSLGNSYITGFFSKFVDFDYGPGVGFLSTGATQDSTDAFVVKIDPQGNYLWGVSIGGNDDNHQIGERLVVDTLGNIYISGKSKGNLQLPNGTSYTAPAGVEVSFILKLDKNGVAQWGYVLGNPSNQVLIEDLIIVENNSILIVGAFKGSMDFNPGTGTSMFYSAGDHDIMIIKLNTLGGYLSGFAKGGNGFDMANSVAHMGITYWVLGSFSGTTNFGSNTLTSSGGNDCFLLQLTNTLFPIKSNKFGGSGGYDLGRKIYNWKNKNLYISSQVHNTSATPGGDLDPSPNKIVPYGHNGQRPCILKLDSQGNTIWIRVIQSNNRTSPVALAVSDSGVVSIGGRFISQSDFDPDTNGVFNLNPPSSEQSGFVCRWTPSGKFIDAYLFPTNTPRNFNISPISSFSTGPGYSGLYLSGNFETVLDVDPSSKVMNLQDIAKGDIFLLKLTNCLSTFQTIVDTACGGFVLPGGDTVFVSNVYTDSLSSANGCDSIIQSDITILQEPDTSVTRMGGQFKAVYGQLSYQWIDCTTGQHITGAIDSVFTPTKNGNYAVIIDNGQCIDTSGCKSLTNFDLLYTSVDSTSIYPNPAIERLFIKSTEEVSRIMVLDAQGNILFKEHEPKHQIKIDWLPDGVYYIILYTDRGEFNQKFVKISY